MEQKKRTPATTGSAAADQLFSLGKNVSQSSVAALNALAAAYSMAPTNFSPFYPYSMLPFGVAPAIHPNFIGGGDFSQAAPGFSFWSNMMAPDYMLNMATLHNLQSPPSSMASASSNGNNVESFSDILRKMPRPPSNTFEKDSNSSASTNDVKVSKSHSVKPSSSSHQQASSSSSYHVNNATSTPSTVGERTHSRRKPSSSNESAASTSTPRYSLAALAEVATSMTKANSNNYNAERGKTPSTSSPNKAFGEEILDFSSSRKRRRPLTASDAAADEPESKIVNRNHYHHQSSKKEESVDDSSSTKRGNDHSSSTSLNHKKLLNSLSTALENRKKSSLAVAAVATASSTTTTSSSAATTSTVADIFTGSTNTLGSLSSSDLKMDPNLLNASAMAWAALSNQLLLAAGMQNELIRTNNQQNNNNLNNNHHNVNNNNRATTSSGSGQKEKNFNNLSSSRDDVTKHERNDKKNNSNSTNNNFGGGNFVVDCGGDPADSVDDTINAVIQSKMRGEKSKRSNDSSSSPRQSQSPRVRGRRCRTGATVREQLALRRAQDETSVGVGKKASSISSTDDVNNGSALDLSVKVSKPDRRSTSSTSSVNDEHVSNSNLNDSSSKRNHQQIQDCSERLSSPKDFDENGCDLTSKKRRLAETDLVRVPLTKGWRRQTCIRAISATGIRGDVIYYAPCGRRLGSYAEALRYMNKNKIRDIGREHFSFSCKVLVGEFLHVRPDSMKNGIVPLSEKEVREMVQKFQMQQTPVVSSPVASSPVASTMSTLVVETSGQKSSSRISGRNSSSRRRGRPVSGGIPVYSSDTKSKDVAATAESTTNHKRNANAAVCTENQRKHDQNMQNHAIMDALRTTEKEIRRNQMEMLRKQEEEYMRQVMILADWEREKNRQQALFARALEAKRREEQREQVYAEKLIREEERLAARNAYLLKMRQQRLPIEDLEVEETKPLVNLDRIENMSLDGQALADLLMVMEFVHNFGHVLKINADEIPTLDDVHAGLFNDKKRLRCLLTLTKILLILVLEYPGLPNGQQGKTFLGLPAKDSSVNFDNLGELLKMFLQTRGEEGAKLAVLFENRPFESLSPSEKVSVLAFMCNELLYCRNVVREIETNIDLAAKLKSDKWTLEGKLRHFKAVQASKQCDKSRDKINSTKSAEEKQDCSDDEKNDCDDDDTLEKVRLKMIAESEPISVEEKNMSVEEVDKEVDQMSKDLDDMSTKMIDAYAKVRSLPIGQDRFHRYYWTLPNVGGILVESLESAGVNNSSVPSTLRLEPCPDTETVIVDCLRDVVNAVCSSLDAGDVSQKEYAAENQRKNLPPASSPVSDESATCEASCSDVNSCEIRKKTSARPVKYDMRRGWWIIKSQEKFNQLQQSFNTHGIRERLFSRTVSKHEDFLKRVTFNEKTPSISALNPIKRAKNSTPETVALTKMRRVMKNLQELEDKVFHANVHIKTWKPPDYESNNDVNDNDASSSPTISRTNSRSSSDDCIASSSSTTSKKSSSYGGDVVRLVELIRKRLLQLEQNVERRYFHPAFNRCSNLTLACSSTSITASAVESRDTSRRSSVVASEMSDDVVASLTDGFVDNSKNNVVDNNDEDDDDTDDVTPAMNRWRAGVAKASSAAQLTMCLEALDSHIAWERSVMKASCQICRRGDDDSQLLLCDGCDLGYHMYCFKPKIDSIPDGDWYCPECVSKATRRPCCLLCCRQTTRPMIVCVDCQRNFHTDCVVDTSKKQNRSTNYVCDGCVAAKTNPESSTTSKNKATAAGGTSPTKKAKCKSSGAKSPKQTQDKKINSKISSTQSSPLTSSTIAAVVAASSTTTNASNADSPLEFHEFCSIILAELDAHKDSWPFKTPVDTKSFPLYKKIIKRPSDLTMIQTKLNGQKYENADQFVTDVKLIFDNCKTFNEDDSPVGKAGHSLRRFFNKRWKELKEMSIGNK